MLPSSLNYIVLIHDMLNYAIPRKSVFINEPLDVEKFEREKKEKDIQNLMRVNIVEEKSLVKEFKQMSLNVSRSLCFETEDKENEPPSENITFNVGNNTNTTCSSVVNNSTNYYTSTLNFERLKRIENKRNVKALFNILDNN
jgi:hypothetical protein